MTRILLVDDEPLVLLTVSDVLMEAGYTVAEAGNAQEALDWLAVNGAPAALITDVNLGRGMDGFALSGAVYHQHPGLPVLLVSGLRPDEAQRPLRSGERFLAKPFLVSDLLDLIGEMARGGAAAPGSDSPLGAARIG